MVTVILNDKDVSLHKESNLKVNKLKFRVVGTCIINHKGDEMPKTHTYNK